MIGGYQPVGQGKIRFVPGLLLQNFDRPLVIDELNRCDIDKVIGPLFTVLSDQPTTLPYRTVVEDEHSAPFVILPNQKPGAAPHEFAPTKSWRILATINSVDKAALYQMSFALTRRFGWVFVDVPRDLQGFILELLRIRGIIGDEVQSAAETPITQTWRAINEVRVIGPAPIIDLISYVRAMDTTVSFLEIPGKSQAALYLDGFYLFLLPMLDGILRSEASTIADRICQALGLSADDPDALMLKQRLANVAI